MGVFRSYVNRALSPFGYEVVRRTPYNLEAQLRAIFSRLAIDCVIDVGAHWGEYGRFLRRKVGYRGRIVSFEPMAESFGRLQTAAAADSAWACRREALGEASRSAELHVFARTDFNSLLPLSRYGAAEFSGEVRDQTTERIELRALDEVFGECVAGLSEPRVYLKLDTQGYDQEVIAGARHSLPRVAALQTEVAVAHIYEGAPRLADAVGRLQGLGFSPTGFFPVTYESDRIHVVEFDCVAVRTPLPDARRRAD